MSTFQHGAGSVTIPLKSMETTVYGKWILAGEHAVIRGSPALVFPVFEKALNLRYIDDGQPLSVVFEGEHGAEFRFLFWGVVERAFELTGHKREETSGQFTVSSTIPVGAGLGASATLCVGIGRWFAAKGWVNESDLAEFCRQLENLFHGESSGVDIAVALSGRGLYFERSGARREVVPLWNPQWYISYSGKRGMTSDCVAKVKTLWQTDPSSGEKIDRDMAEAVLAAEQSLLSPYSEETFDRLAQAINKARGCFEHWGLASGEMGSHLQWLLNQGAYAVKPTGSGDGGYALSLWRKTPPPDALAVLIPTSRLK